MDATDTRVDEIADGIYRISTFVPDVECGAMNEFLAVAPRAQVAHGLQGCLVSLDDLADRPPRPLAHGETLDLGGKEVLRRRVLHLNTPHVPHNWEARVLFEETTGTLLCGDLFTHLGNGPPVTDHDLVEPALDAEEVFRQTSCLTAAVETLRSLARLAPSTLAVMHGSSYGGDGAAALRALADGYQERFGPEREFAARPSALAGASAPQG